MHATTFTPLLQPSRSGRRQPHVQSPLVPSGKSNGMENVDSVFVSTCCYHRYQAQRRSRCYQCWQEDFNDMSYAGVEFVFAEGSHSYRQYTVIYIQDDCSVTASARRHRSNSSQALQHLLLAFFLSTSKFASWPSSSHQLTYSPTRHF